MHTGYLLLYRCLRSKMYTVHIHIIRKQRSVDMKFGVFLPISGRASGPETLMEAARSAEALGFDAVWSADRVVTPWQINTRYPYSENHEFIVPPDRPFLDSLTCLAFLAGCTEKITLGISVLVLPYRHPLYWTRSRLHRATLQGKTHYGHRRGLDGGGVRSPGHPI